MQVVPVIAAGLTEVFSGAGALATLVGAAATKAARSVIKAIEERIVIGCKIYSTAVESIKD